MLQYHLSTIIENEIFSWELQQTIGITENGMIHIVICGNGFLYNMVRIIVGTLIKVGLGVYPPEHVKEIIEAKNRDAAGPKSPAAGLTLVKIQYEELGEY